jgi:hypothetical protein
VKATRYALVKRSQDTNFDGRVIDAMTYLHFPGCHCENIGTIPSFSKYCSPRLSEVRVSEWPNPNSTSLLSKFLFLEIGTKQGVGFIVEKLNLPTGMAGR